MTLFKREKLTKVPEKEEGLKKEPEEKIITPEETKEKGFEELLELAKKEIQEEKKEEIRGTGIIKFEKVKLPKNWGEWEKGGREKSQRNAASISGCVEYQLIAHPELREALKKSKSYEERKKNLIPKWNELGVEEIDSEFKEKSDSFSQQLFEVINDRAVTLNMGSGKGRFELSPKQEFGSFLISTPLVSKTEDYLPELKENIKKKESEICYSTEDKNKLKKVLEDCKEGTNLHIGTFGKAALKEGDLVPAIEAFEFTGELENPEIIKNLKEKMLKLEKSEKPEDKELLRKASEKLIEISKEEGKEKREEEESEKNRELKKVRKEIKELT